MRLIDYRHYPYGAIDTHLHAHLPTALQRKVVERRLRKVVLNAYRNVPFYRNSFDQAGFNPTNFRGFDDLKRLPFLNKVDVQEHYPRGLVARGTNLDRCEHSATTGSSGLATNFIFTPKTYAYYHTTSFKVYTMIGYRPWHRATYIKYTAVPAPGLGPIFRIGHIPSMVPVEEHITALRKQRPDLLVGYASLILDIARNVKPADLKIIKPRFISVNSELSTQEQRDEISAVFNCPVYDEYSSEETWMIASQCREHQYHLFTNNVWVEFLDSEGNEVPPGEVGEIVLTTLQSPAMPFIRYRIGDLGRAGTQPCACGSSLPVLASFEGRADDSFVLSNGGHIPALKLLNTFTTFIKADKDFVREFKLVQTDLAKATIHLTAGSQYTTAQTDALINKLQSIIPEPVEFMVNLVDGIGTGGSVKHKAIESLVTQNPTSGVSS